MGEYYYEGSEIDVFGIGKAKIDKIKKEKGFYKIDLIGDKGKISISLEELNSKLEQKLKTFPFDEGGFGLEPIE